MAIHPNDPTTASDLTLVEAARAGDRLAFGVLYLRHHAAAWRVACLVSRFSPDAELAVIEGFTRVFSALPPKAEQFGSGGVSFRPYLLACVRQVALNRARAAGRDDASSGPLAGLAPNGELVLSSLEHHVARGALAALPERSRTALWLSEVEAMTPAEIAGLIGKRPEEVTALVAQARHDLHTASQAILCGHEVRSDCRFTVANLETYEAGTLESPKGVLVRSHLDICPTCRMRLGELANGPATMAAAVPAAPLLGGEAQHHWVNSAADVHPADRLLPPGLAAAAPINLPLPARHVVAVAAGVPEMARRAGRTVRPALPVMALVVAWVAVMVSLPQLMQPDTAAAPGDLALPAVQAYMPDYQPGTGSTRPTKATAPATAGADAREFHLPPLGNPGTELAVQFGAAQAAALAPAAEPAGRPAVKLVATTRRTTPTTRPAPAPIVAAVAPITVTAVVEPAAIVPGAVVPAVTAPTKKSSKQLEDLKRRLEKLQQKARYEAASLESRRLDLASSWSKAAEESDGRVARREARRRHTDHAESA